MQESFLHFLWRWRRFSANDLLTTEGQALEILHPGEWNRHAGPDFFNARLRINHTNWAGNVEIHLRASDWHLHKHSDDPAYDNVVLHVVYEEDQPVRRANGERIPCLCLQGRIPAAIFQNYQRLEQERHWVPCQTFLPDLPDLIRLNWLDRMLVERLEYKTQAIENALAATQNHWEEAFYRLLARSFGLKVNVEPFETLARALPLSLLMRHKHHPLQVEALLFGQAGMLQQDFVEAYPNMLAKEYRFLQHKLDLTPMDGAQWKFLRLRPANFPTIRIAQFAVLLQRSDRLFSQVLEAESVRELMHLFDVRLEGYWAHHFVWDKPAVSRPKSLGKGFVSILVINTIVPFLFHWGRVKQLPRYEKKALDWLESLEAESNSVVEEWQTLGFQAHNAFQSQALLHLKTHWCDAKKCLECAVGNAVLK
jgi:hypothetical protein